jgi:hypothetical protein
MDIDLVDIFEDDVDIWEIIEYGFPRRHYVRADYFHEMDELGFFRRFRLKKATVLHVLTLIEHELEYPTNINESLSPINQLLTTLRLYASAGHLQLVADFMGIHLSTASRCVAKVSAALARLAPNFIKMPQTDQERAEVQNDFFEIARFPRVLGAIDCTHIRIQSLGGRDAEIFRNRKGYFSINVQTICNAKLEILDIVARWPGSSHDSTIFNNSRIRARFENNEFDNHILLGDGGYPIRSYFLTPLAAPRNRGQQLYNESHIRTRNTVERSYGNWKRRFPVLAYGMRLKQNTILSIIVATAVLQNIAIQMNEDIPPIPEDINAHELQILINDGQIPTVAEANNDFLISDTRTNFINNYFSQI